jgi:hypothetical protein
MSTTSWAVVAVVVLACSAVAYGVAYAVSYARGRSDGYAKGYNVGWHGGSYAERRAFTEFVEKLRRESLQAQADLEYLYEQARERIEDRLDPGRESSDGGDAS